MSEFDPTVAPAGGDTPAPSPASATPEAYAPPAATPQAPTQAPATGAGIPEGYVPSYRLRETREAAMREAQQFVSQREQAYQQQLNQVQRQLHALVGVSPQAQNPEVDAIRQQFQQLFPRLAKLEERGEDVFGLLDRAGDLESQTSHYWQTYGRQTVDRLVDQVQTALGTTLTEDGKRSLHSSFVGFVQSSPEMTARYANDPSIVDDFVRAFTSNFIDPVRRTASAGVSQRASMVQNLPQDTPGGVPRMSPAPTPKNLDERGQLAWALYEQTRKQ